MGAQAAENTSQTRNRSTPTALAFSRARSVGAGLRSRPIGSPSRMVTPAMKPSSMVDIKLTDLPRLHITEGARPPQPAKVRVPLLVVKSVQPATGGRAAESHAPAVGREPLAGPGRGRPSWCQ